MAAGMGAGKLDHSEVERTARATRDAFVGLLGASVRRIAERLARPVAAPGGAS
jgi:hypothetical protein